MNNTCPRCGHVYAVTERDIGKRLPCKKCRIPLVVDATGIRLDEPASAPSEPVFVVTDEPVSAPPRRRSPADEARDAGTEVLAALISPYALPTYVMAFGVFLVIVFLFLSLLDQAKVTYRQAAIKAGEQREARLERLYQRKKDRTPADDEARNKQKEAWEKERELLQEDVADAQVSADRWHYWYLWGQLIGFLVTAVAALAYMSPKMPGARRVVGAVVFAAVVVLVFLRILVMGGGRGAG